VPIRLLDNVKQLSYLLEDYEVQAIKPTPSIPSPKVDSHTTLYGIINRMLKKEAEERPELEKGLLFLDQTHGIFRKFMAQYKNCEPQIHAEVLALEHFYRSRKSFAAKDRYIGCSKASCVCCEMYFKYHPARMVVPKSHHKVWRNWGPPYVENYAQKGPIAKQQLAILNKMTEEFRREIMLQVIGRSSPPCWHADSRTEITQSRRSSFTSSLEDDSRTDLPENIDHWLLHQEAESVKLIAQEQSHLEESVIPDSDSDSDSDTGGVSLCIEILASRETPGKEIYASL
jgi:tRNA(Arg) A34 adenosine deaminase TadA